MEEEVERFIKAWVSAIISVSYCYYVSQNIKPGVLRFISILPICALFLVLPLFFSCVHFSFIMSTWLMLHTNFKLILFAFEKGPLTPNPPSLTQFLCLTCLPIHPQRNHKSQDHFPKWVFAIKLVIHGVVLHIYKNTTNLHPILQLGLYPLHLYLSLEIPLTLLNVFLTVILGRNLEPFFNEPYLATSLQDFWSRRWNLPVSDLLRLAVCTPVRKVCQKFINYENASIIGVLASFLISGFIHELVFFYAIREVPTWEVTGYFVLHGVCVVVEVRLKKKTFSGRWVVRPMVSTMLTVGFVCLSAGWLFFPHLKRNRVMERFADESFLLNDFVKRELLVYVGIS